MSTPPKARDGHVPLPRAEEVGLIACDVDGTLLTTRHVLHPRTERAIRHVRATRPDLPIVISSGKQFVSCQDLRDQLDLGTFPASHMHGGAIYNSASQLSEVSNLPPSLVLSLVQDLQRSNHATFLFTVDECLLVNEEVGGKDWLNEARKYDKNVVNWTDPKRREEALRQVETGEKQVVKLTVCAEPGEVDDLISTLAAAYPTLGLTRAIAFILELHDPRINKGTSLTSICKSLSIPLSRTLVFGDGENDVAMFETARWSVAMGNAMQIAKANATFVLEERNNDGGVGVFLEKVFGRAEDAADARDGKIAQKL